MANSALHPSGVVIRVVIRVFTCVTEVETVKTVNQGYLWLYGCDRGLGLRPRLYASSVCDDSGAEAAYAAIVAL